jgi:hypothetical protein
MPPSSGRNLTRAKQKAGLVALSSQLSDHAVPAIEPYLLALFAGIYAIMLDIDQPFFWHEV